LKGKNPRTRRREKLQRTRGRNSEKEEGKRQQELAVDVSHRASWDEAWKRYAAKSIPQFGKEARGFAGQGLSIGGFLSGAEIRGKNFKNSEPPGLR